MTPGSLDHAPDPHAGTGLRGVSLGCLEPHQSHHTCCFGSVRCRDLTGGGVLYSRRHVSLLIRVFRSSARKPRVALLTLCDTATYRRTRNCAHSCGTYVSRPTLLFSPYSRHRPHGHSRPSQPAEKKARSNTARTHAGVRPMPKAQGEM